MSSSPDGSGSGSELCPHCSRSYLTTTRVAGGVAPESNFADAVDMYAGKIKICTFCDYHEPITSGASTA